MPFRRLVAVLAAGCWLSSCGLVLALALEGCGGPDGSSRRVLLRTTVAVDAAALEQFTTALGWEVELTRAAIAAGPFYYFDGAPPVAAKERSRAWQYAARFLGLGVAHAHPGHYQAGNAVGQMLGSSSIDLLAGAAEFPDGDGVTGSYRSARLTFAAPSGPAKALLDGHVVLAEGVARKRDEATRYFRAFAHQDEIAQRARDGQIEGCELARAQVEGDGRITLTVNPRIWFDWVEFGSAPEGSADAPAEWPADSDARIGFVLGVTQLSAYKFRFGPE